MIVAREGATLRHSARSRFLKSSEQSEAKVYREANGEAVCRGGHWPPATKQPHQHVFSLWMLLSFSEKKVTKETPAQSLRLR
jgi:hypothetical protein